MTKDTYSLLIFYLTLLIVISLLVTQRAQAQTPRTDFPPTELQFKHTPQTIQSQAKKGNFFTIRVVKDVKNISFFSKIVTNSINAKRGIVSLAVVVEHGISHPTTQGKLRHLRQQLAQVLYGNAKKGIKGQAELSGGYVTGIVPIQYQPQEVVNDKKMGPNDIYLTINEQHYIYSEADFNKTAAMVVKDLERGLQNGLHLETTQEYDKRIAAKKAHIRMLKQDIQQIDQTIKEIDQLK